MHSLKPQMEGSFIAALKALRDPKAGLYWRHG
jgi:hypothetical protein